METLAELMRLPTPTFGGFVFTIWFIGFVGGYVAGRAHAAWITMNNFMRKHSK